MRNLKLISTFVAIVGTLSATMFAVYDHLSMQRQEEAAFPYSNKVAVGGAAEGATIINGSDNQVTIQGDNRVIVQNSPVTPDVVERECMNGIWSWKYEYPSSVGMIQMQGTSEYFDNGSYTVKGLMRVVLGTVPSLDIGYQIYGTGDWQLRNSKLTTRLRDMKSSSPTMLMGEDRIDTLLSQQMNESLSLENALPKGMSSEYRILEGDADHMVLQTHDLQGDPLVIHYTRQKGEFLFELS